MHTRFFAFILALGAALALTSAACTIKDGGPSGDDQVGDDDPMQQQCTIDVQCSASDPSTQAYCSDEGRCEEYATNCFGIKTRRINGNSTPIEAWGGWNVPPNQAPRLGTVLATTAYTSVPYTGTCSTVSAERHDCTIEYAGGLGMNHKEYWEADKCTFDACNNVPAVTDPQIRTMCQAARFLELWGLTHTSYSTQSAVQMVDN